MLPSLRRVHYLDHAALELYKIHDIGFWQPISSVLYELASALTCASMCVCARGL